MAATSRRTGTIVGPQGIPGPAGPPGGVGPAGAAGAAGTPGTLAHYVLPISMGVSATQQALAVAKQVGGVSMDPSVWNQLKLTSTITLHVLLDTTNAGNFAGAQLWRISGGAPTVIATVTTTSTTLAEVTADVSTSFRPGAPAGVYVLVFYLQTNNGTDAATCTGAWLDIAP